MSKTRLGAVAALAVAGMFLSGCGSASPGVAAQVGDRDISTNRVDELAGQYCQALEDQLTGNSQVVPHRYFRSGVAGTLAMREVADQLAAEYDVEAGPTYDKQVAELEQNVAVLDDEVQEAVIEVESSPAYVEAVQRAVGEVLLEAEGAEQGYDDQVARGRTAFEAWVSEHGVTFDPSLGIELVKGNIESVDSSLSVAVGEQARAGQSEEPDETYARALPDSHRCG